MKVDIHSHLLPGIDDGSQSMEETLSLVKAFYELGYRKLVTTPHVMSDIYRNTPAIISGKLTDVRHALSDASIEVDIEAAAEYYLDESLISAVHSDEPLLTFGDRYLLFETNFLSEPLHLKEFIFQASTRGYKLILAHPERYAYLHHDMDKVEDLLNRGVQFQINISSITGLYSKPVRQLAVRLIEKGWVHWLGSDCHQAHHVELIREALSSKYMKKALNLPLLNNSLQ